MQLPTIERMIAFLFEQPSLLEEDLSINWHAGEPLVLPIRFYESVVDMQKRHKPPDIAVKHRIQTNGTLITQAWCEFIRANDFMISVSLDGPKRFHDSRRLTRSRRGSFDRVLRGIHLLQSNGIPFDIVGVMDLESLSNPDEIFEFYSSLSPRQIGLNFEEVVGTNTYSSLNHARAKEDVKRFIMRFVSLRDNLAPTIRLRDFDALSGAICAWSGAPRSFDSVPLRTITISWDGKISTFSPELLGLRNPEFGDFVFGNLFESSLSDIMENLYCRALQAQVEAGIRRCKKDCGYFGICGGGSPINKWSENGSFDSSETVYCRLRIQAHTDVVLDVLEDRLGLKPFHNASTLQRMKRLLPLGAQQIR